MASAGTGSTEKTSVSVALRIRPITNEELSNLPTRFQRQVLATSQFVPNQVVVQTDKKLNFSFDNVFGPESTQREVYEGAVVSLIDKFLEGYNVTILAYGQTSSGKTHTMGTADHMNQLPETKGIIPRAMNTLFSNVNSAQYKSRKFTIKVSFIEIYNEDLIDLLAEQDSESRPQVTIREDSKGNILWSGLQEFRVNSAEEVTGHLARGSLNRQVGATDMNAQSSRSHAIFSVTLIQQKFVPANGLSASPIVTPPTPLSTNRPSTPSRMITPTRSNSRMSKRFDEGDWVSCTSKFHFVDLAGSERLKRTSATGERVKEGISINSGLLALGNVISALGDPNRAKHVTHIPYRDSKLTRLLQDSLGGNAQTLMIACVSPAEFNLNETVNTLKYANRARNIKNLAVVNQEESGWQDLEHLQALVVKLRAEIKAIKAGSGINTGSGRSTPSTLNGRDTPTHLRRPSTPLSINSNSNTNLSKDKDLELLEEQLLQLQQSYFELSQKFAKANAELAKHQDNADGVQNLKLTTTLDANNSLAAVKEEEEKNFMLRASNSFQEAVEPVIEEYEKSISSLESQLALSRAALNHTETMMQEQENKLLEVEQLNDQNRNLIGDLKNKISKLHEREATTEHYIKDLELKLESHSVEQKRDQELISELRSKITQLKTAGSNSECYIQDLEMRLTKTDDRMAKISQNAEKLEKRLAEREESYQELEAKLKHLESDAERKMLLSEINDRDRRITMLENKVEELIGEVDKLRKLKEHENDMIHERSLSSTSSNVSDEDTPCSTPPTSNTPTPTVETTDRLIIAGLESKLSILRQNHGDTLANLNEIRAKYHVCLREIDELHQHLDEAKLMEIDINEHFKVQPATPMTPPAGAATFPSRLQAEQETDPLIDAANRVTHRKARSLSAEIKGAEKRDLASAAIVQNLQIELKQLESLHDDKAKGLDAVKKEFAKLEMSHRETLDIVEELRHEIKKRDAIAQVELMSIMTSSEYNDGGYSATTSEIDQLDIVQRLRDEVEILKEAQRRTMETLSERQKLGNDDQVLKFESEIEQLKAELRNAEANEEEVVSAEIQTEITHEHVLKLEAKVNELEEKLADAQEIQRQENLAEAVARLEGVTTSIESDENKDQEAAETSSPQQDETLVLRKQIEKLQGDIEAKSHTIATLLLPSIDHQNNIRRLEDELQELREAHRRTVEEKRSHGLSVPDEKPETAESQIFFKSLEARMKDLESQLIKAKDGQHVPTPRNSHFHVNDPTQRTVDSLQEKLEILQQELASKAEAIESLRGEQDIVVALQEQLVILKSDIRRKYELIDMLKRDLIDKSLLQQKLKTKESEAEALKTKLGEAQNREEALTAEMKELKASWELDLQELKNARDEAIKELETAKSDYVDQKGITNQLDRELRDLREELSNSKRNLENNSQEYDELSRLLTDTLRQREDQEKKVRALEIEISSYKVGGDSDINAVRQELTNARLEMEAQNEILAELETQVTSIEKQRDEKVTQVNELKRTLEEAEIKHIETVDSLESNLADMQAELAQAKVSWQLSKETIISLEDNLGMVRSELSKAKSTDIKRAALITELEEKLQEAITALKEKEQGLAVKDTLVSELEASVQKTKLELEMVRTSETKEAGRVKQLEAKLADVESRLRTRAVSEQLDTSSELGQKQAELVKELQTKLTETESKLSTFADLDSSPDHDHVERLTEQLAQAESKQTKMEAELKDQEKEGLLNKQLLSEVQEIVTLTKMELEEVRAAGSRHDRRIKSLESKLQDTEKLRDQETAKLKEANQELEALKDECIQLQHKIDDAQTEAFIQRYESIDDAMVDELRKAHDEAKSYRDRVVELEKATQKLESEKYSDIHDYTQQIKTLQDDLNSLAEEFAEAASKYEEAEENSKQQKNRISELQTALEMAKNAFQNSTTPSDEATQSRGSGPTNTTLAKLAVANESLRQTNDELTAKIVKSDDKVKFLESELARVRSETNETVKERLENSEESFLKDGGMLDQKVNALRQSVEMAVDGNEKLVNRSDELEDKMKNVNSIFADCKDRTTEDTTIFEQEITRLKEINQKLEEEMKKMKANKASALALAARLTSRDSGFTSSTPNTPRDSLSSGLASPKNDIPKGMRHESGIPQPISHVKSPHDKNGDFEHRNGDGDNSPRGTPSNYGMGMCADLDAVGGFRMSTVSTSSSSSDVTKPTKISLRSNIVGNLAKAPPPTPPPNLPLPPPPTTSLPPIPQGPGTPPILGYNTPILPPPRSPLPPRSESSMSRSNASDSGTRDDLSLEIHKLHKKLAKMEGENIQHRQEKEQLESQISESETNMRIAKQQLSILQREKLDLVDQVKSLRTQLEEAKDQVETTKSNVEEEKKALESYIEEERKAKEKAERAKMALESRMEELIAKRSKFMCF